NHLHLLVEAANNAALSRGMKGLLVRMARGLNRLIGRKGTVFTDRYHAHVLRSPTEARNAVRYVLTNTHVHAARRGRPVPAAAAPLASVPTQEWVAYRGSAAPVPPPPNPGGARTRQLTLFPAGPKAPPETWLLRHAIGSTNL